MMAGSDATRNVQVNLTANVDPFQRAMADAGRGVAALSAGVVTLGRHIDDLIKRAGKRVALIGVSDIAGLTAAAEAANRLDVAMTQIRANSALTGQSVGKLRGEVMNLSKSVPDTTGNIARLMGQLQSMGITGTKNLALLTKQAEQLAAATNTPPGQLLTGIISMNREMGSGLANVSNYSSALIELSKTMGVAPNDIMAFATSIQAVAQQAGYTQTQVMGLAAAFTRAGADSGAAASVFTTITTQINQAVVTGNAQLQQFGKLIHMTGQEFKSFAQAHPEQAFQRIISAIGSQGQGGILTLSQMGLDNPRYVRAIAQMTSGQANISQAMNTASDAFTKNNAMAKSSAAAWDDLSATMQKFRNQVDDIVIRLGGPMLHVLDLFFEGLNHVLGPLNAILGAMGPIPGIVAGIGGAFLAVTGTIVAFSLAVMAAAAAWRLLSGTTGTGALQGLVNGYRNQQGQGPFVNPTTIVRRNPINMDERSRMGQRLYAFNYGVGQRFSAPPPVDPTLAQRAMARTGRIAGSVLGFPFRKFKAEGVETIDTLRHPFNPWNRSVDATSPYGFLGMYQRGNRWLENQGGVSGAIRGAGVRLSTKLGMDTTEAEAKLNAIKEQAQRRITARLDAGLIPNTDLRAAVGGRSIPGAEYDIRNVANNRPDLLEAGLGGRGMLYRTAGAGARGIGGLLNGLGLLGSAVSSVALPLTALAAVGVPLYEGFKHLHNSAQDAADRMDDLGAALVRTAGGVYNKPGNTITPKPADKVDPFGTTEVQTGVSSAFQKSAGEDIGMLQGRKGINRTRVAQQIIQNVVANNGGQGLTTAQQQVLREELIAAYGPDQGRQVYRSLNINGMSAQSAAQLNAALLVGTKDDSNIFESQFQGTNSSKRIKQAVTPLTNQLASGQMASAARGLAAIDQAVVAAGGGKASALNAERIQVAFSDVIKQLNKDVPKDQRLNIDTSQIFTVKDFVTALGNAGDRGKTLATELSKAGLVVSKFTNDVSYYSKAASAAGTGKPPGLIERLAGQYGFSPMDATNADYMSQMATITYQAMRGGPRGKVPGMTDVAALTAARDAWEQYKAGLDATSPALQGVQNQIDMLNNAISQQNQLFQTPAMQAGGFASQVSGMISQFGTGGLAGQSEQTYLGMANQQIAAGESQLKSYMTTVHEFHLQEKDAFYQRNQQIKQMNHEFAEQIRQLNFQTANIFGNPAQMVQSQFTMGADSALIGMQRQMSLLRESRSTMDRLHAVGLSRDAIRLLGLDDPKNVEQAQRYLGDFAANPKLVAQFNRSIKGRLKIANGIDTDQNNSKFADMKRQFDYTASQAEKAFKHSQQQAMISINELGKTLFTSMADLNHQAMTSGLANIQQYAAGIMSAIGQVQTATTNFLNSSAAGGNSAGGPTIGGRKWTGTPHGNFSAPSGLHRAGKSAGVNSGFLLSSVSKPGTSMDHMGNPDLHWGKDVLVAPDNRTLSGNAKLAQQMAKAMGWGDGPEWAALYQIWQQESGFSTTAGSPRAAYGIPQSDPGIKMAAAGADWRTNPRTQIRWGLNNIAKNYGDPLGAWAHKSRTGWYAKGGVFGSSQVIGVGENGPEAVLPLNSIGASFVSQVIARTMPITKSQVAMTHTAPKSSVVFNAPVSNHLDYSTAYTGDIHVEASDPNEMQRKLEAKKRLEALRRPVARR